MFVIGTTDLLTIVHLVTTVSVTIVNTFVHSSACLDNITEVIGGVLFSIKAHVLYLCVAVCVLLCACYCLCVICMLLSVCHCLLRMES